MGSGIGRSHQRQKSKCGFRQSVLNDGKGAWKKSLQEPDCEEEAILPPYINPAAADELGDDNERKQTGLASRACCKGLSSSSRLPRNSRRNLEIEGGLDEGIGALGLSLWPDTRPSNHGVSQSAVLAAAQAHALQIRS
ncbi:hypothetical protein K439DRAFT_1657979 [Ramaria rubella]|nr:hypothetical protein K439DRAFT_1657979 [Ramaria rubella]